ncbi:M-phase inducer phosphatase-like [Argopecten irradians]|uniref:M-phase inducer phosphatase-like n=1 Tax=Argopecten irradians TaxID=31199 RepID=UPI0037243BF8
MDIVNRFVDEEDLIGDGSDQFCLPTVRGKHQDLKSISPDTMVNILTGRYDDVIGSFRIIDCRYPYEYNGGHIKVSINSATKKHKKVRIWRRKDKEAFKLSLYQFLAIFCNGKYCCNLQNAENLYTRDQVQQLLYNSRSYDVTGRRNILIFHCEFSSERGPKM